METPTVNLTAGCEACGFFHPLGENTNMGSCKRYPPIPIFLVEEDMTASVFPKVTTDTFCGEFRPQWSN